MMPIFSMAFANSSGSTVPLLLRSKYLKLLSSTVSSLVMPDDFCDSFAFSVFSKLLAPDQISPLARQTPLESTRKRAGLPLAALPRVVDPTGGTDLTSA